MLSDEEYVQHRYIPEYADSEGGYGRCVTCGEPALMHQEVIDWLKKEELNS